MKEVVWMRGIDSLHIGEIKNKEPVGNKKRVDQISRINKTGEVLRKKTGPQKQKTKSKLFREMFQQEYNRVKEEEQKEEKDARKQITNHQELFQNMQKERQCLEAVKRIKKKDSEKEISE